MTVSESIKYMGDTGKPIVAIKRLYDDPGFTGYYQLFRNDEILKLMPDTSCAASIRCHYSLEEFTSLGGYHTFEPYEKPA